MVGSVDFVESAAAVVYEISPKVRTELPPEFLDSGVYELYELHELHELYELYVLYVDLADP